MIFPKPFGKIIGVASSGIATFFTFLFEAIGKVLSKFIEGLLSVLSVVFETLSRYPIFWFISGSVIIYFIYRYLTKTP